MQFQRTVKLASLAVAFTMMIGVRHVAAQTLLWAQMGGGAGGDAQHYGVVGQGLPAGAGDSLRAGFLAHPLFLNAAPLVLDTSVHAGSGEALSVDVRGEDLDGQVVAGRVVVPASHGAGSFAGTTLHYQSDDGFSGTDSLGFVAVDDQGAASDTAWARISVAGPASLAPRKAARPLVGSPDVQVPRLMVSRTGNELRGGLVFPRSPSEPQGLSVSILLAGPSDVRVQIYDHMGTLVTWADAFSQGRDFLDLPAGGDGRRVLTARWDLRDRSGSPVAEGVYLWRILIEGQDGQKLETVRKTGVKP